MSDESEALPITPTLVRWARSRAGFSLEEASKVFKKIAAWEDGASAPTYPQLEQMAEKFKCPVAVFFFPAPPDLPNVEKTFRTLSPDGFAAIPRTVLALLRRGQAMQINLAELNEGRNPASRLITRDLKFSPSTPLDAIAAQLRSYLGVSLDMQSRWKSVDVALEGWREAFAQVGIYVFKEAFHARNYFGFCLYDDEYPILYVNNSCAKSRQIFTLFHELGHLLFHTSGIDISNGTDFSALPRDQRRIEAICNGLAAHVLVPESALDDLLRGKPANRETAAYLASYFSVSREVIYRKMLDRQLIAASEYTDASKFWESQIQTKGKGGDYYNNQHAYLGTRYIDLAFQRYYQRRIDDLKLADYLNIKPKSLPAFEARFGGVA